MRIHTHTHISLVAYPNNNRGVRHTESPFKTKTLEYLLSIDLPTMAMPALNHTGPGAEVTRLGLWEIEARGIRGHKQQSGRKGPDSCGPRGRQERTDSPGNSKKEISSDWTKARSQSQSGLGDTALVTQTVPDARSIGNSVCVCF